MLILVMLDGLRPDAIPLANAPTLHHVIENGASTMTARSVMPSITLPCHMAMFHSVPPTRHGVTTNTFTPMARPLPGLIEVLHGAGIKCAFIHNWEPLRNLNTPEHLALSYFRENSYEEGGDQQNARMAVQLLTEAKPDFAFVYFGNVDSSGHFYGWMSEEYLAQVARIDDALKTLMDGMGDDTSYIIHADHGGHDRNHGEDVPEDMTIPWMSYGPMFKSGVKDVGSVSLLDDAPTIATLLKAPVHPQWEGRVIHEAIR